MVFDPGVKRVSGCPEKMDPDCKSGIYLQKGGLRVSCAAVCWLPEGYVNMYGIQ